MRELEARRHRRGWTRGDLASRAGVDPDELADVEALDEGLREVAELGTVRRISAALELDPRALLDQPCAFHEQGVPFLPEYALPRHELVRNRLQAAGLTAAQLACRMGLRESAVEAAASDPDALERWSVAPVEELARRLGIPADPLLALGCGACGRAGR